MNIWSNAVMTTAGLAIKGLAEELIDVPDVPSSNGTYVLKTTRSASGISYKWVEETTTASTASTTEAGETV